MEKEVMPAVGEGNVPAGEWSVCGNYLHTKELRGVSEKRY
jgi:hypothetical protein